MKRKLALLLVVLIVLAGQLFAADHYAYGTPLGMRILVDPTASKHFDIDGNRLSTTSIGYDFSANYMGFFWNSGSSSAVEGGRLSTDGRTSSYRPERYSPAGRSFLTPTSHEVASDAWKNIGVNAQIDILTSGPANKPQGDYRLSFGASLRQSLLDNLFLYENFGPTFRFDMTAFGVYGDVGVAYTPIWELTVVGGIKTVMEFGSDFIPAFDFIIYAGVGYGF